MASSSVVGSYDHFTSWLSDESTALILRSILEVRDDVLALEHRRIRLSCRIYARRHLLQFFSQRDRESCMTEL